MRISDWSSDVCSSDLLERIVQIVFEEFEDVLALATQDWKRKGRISKIILYGSYARGGWVDEPHTAKGYQSDYDLLIIVNDKRLTDRTERSEEHTSELQSLMRSSYADLCLQQKTTHQNNTRQSDTYNHHTTTHNNN